jgi:hypothetical protein
MNENELAVPPTAEARPGAFEILRVWIDQQEHHVNVKVGVWEDPVAWGVTLAYLVTAVADAYRQNEGLDPAQTIARVKLGFDEGMKHLPK